MSRSLFARVPARVRLLVAYALLLALILLALRQPLASHAKALLLLSQELPGLPFKPLHLVTAEPDHQQLRFDAPHGPVVADLFVPSANLWQPASGSRPGLILAMGVRTSDRDRTVLLNFARTLSRLGFVVLWPRLQALDQGVSSAEDPKTFVLGVRYLEQLSLVARERISLLGFSVGASTALVAAADPGLTDRVRAVIFFGGYYDLSAYLVNLATGTFVLDGQVVPWQPHEEAIGHARLVLESMGAEETIRVLDASSRDEASAVLSAAPASERAELRGLDPAAHLHQLLAPIFILHARNDPFVPYVESIKLRDALPASQVEAFLLTDLFEHAQFERGLSWQTLRELRELYGFVYAVLDQL